MAEYATKIDVQEVVDKALGKAVDDLSGVIAGFAQQVDERFNRLEFHVDRIDTGLAEIRARLDKQDERMNHLLDTVDAFIKRLDDSETNNLVRNDQFERLLAWAKKVSKKTGIPLEGF